MARERQTRQRKGWRLAVGVALLATFASGSIGCSELKKRMGQGASGVMAVASWGFQDPPMPRFGPQIFKGADAAKLQGERIVPPQGPTYRPLPPGSTKGVTAAKGATLPKRSGVFSKSIASYYGKGRSIRMMVETDKPLYKPGETIWVRTAEVFLQANKTRDVRESIVYELVNPRGVVIKKIKAIVSAGHSHNQFKLKRGAVGGPYTIRIRNSYSKAKAEHKIVVSNYQPPRLKKKLEFVRKGYGPGDSVNATLSLKRATGGVLAKHKIKLVARLAGKAFKTWTHTTDDKGKALLSFALPKSFKTDDGSLTVLISDAGITESISRPIPLLLKQLKVGFFPEGGHAVAGFPARVYVSIRRKLDGKPQDIEGVIKERGGKVVAKVKTFHDGMGRFAFVPKKGTQYALSITKPIGLSAIYPLPAARSKGVVMHAVDDFRSKRDDLQVVVYAKRARKVVLTALQHEALVGQKAYSLQKGRQLLTLPLRKQWQGIVRLTLFDKDYQPIAERLVFRRRGKGLQIEVMPHQKMYQPRQTVMLKIRVKDPAGNAVPKARLGVSVVDDTVLSFADDHEPHFLTQRFISRQLVGKIYKPNYYFNKKKPKSWRGLDLVMGTHGWRGFSWRQVATAKAPPALGKLPMYAFYAYRRSRYRNRRRRRGRGMRRGRRLRRARLNALLGQLNGGVGGLRAGGGARPGGVFGRGGMNLGGAKGKGMALPRRVLRRRVRVRRRPRPARRRVRRAPRKPMAAPAPVAAQPVAPPPPPAKAMAAEPKPMDKLLNKQQDNQKAQVPRGIAAKGLMVLKDVATGDDAAPRKKAKKRKRRRVRARPRPRVRWRRNLRRKRARRRRSRLRWQYARVFPTRFYKNPKPNATRTDFRDTLFWKPNVVTDAWGEAKVSFGLNDSISSFRVRVSGVGKGLVGRDSHVIASKRPFFMVVKLPLEVSAGDAMALPLTLRNDTKAALTIRVKTGMSRRFKLMENPLPGELKLAAGEARTYFYPVRVVRQAGTGSIWFRASANGVSDSFRRKIKIKPRGFPREKTWAGTFKADGNKVFALNLPDDIAKASPKASVVFYPNPLSSMIKGMASMIRAPYGCFEQASSSNYPNVMIVSYLRSRKMRRPSIMRRAYAYLGRGYGKLVSYESKSKGYEWFGKSPGHEALTAYGLLQFTEMKRIYPRVSRAMIRRTSAWLVARRNGKGGFKQNSRALDTFGRASKHITNAYITFALAESGRRDMGPELKALVDKAFGSSDPYFLALVVNAALKVRGRNESAKKLLKKLVRAQKADGSFRGTTHSITRSYGKNLHIETTALSILAMLRGRVAMHKTLRALQWMRKQRSRYGGFGTTQATILALRAIIAFDAANRSPKAPGTIKVALNGKRADKTFTKQHVGDITIKSFAKYLKPGRNAIKVKLDSKASIPYSVGVRYFTREPVSQKGVAVRLETSLAKRSAKMGEIVRLTATLTNTTDKGVPMTLARISFPGAFTTQLWQLKALRDKKIVDFYETNAREVIVYFRSLAPKAKKVIHLDLVARVTGNYTGAASSAYLYYTNDKKHWTKPLTVSVAP